MNVIYDESVKQWKEVLPLLEQATNQLQQRRFSVAEPVVAVWRRTENGQGNALATLTLSSHGESVSASFKPQDLQSPDQMRYRLRNLWGDLLEALSNANLRRIQELVSQLPTQGE